MMRVLFFFKSKCLLFLVLFIIGCVAVSCENESLLGTDILPTSDKTVYMVDSSLEVSLLTEQFGDAMITDMDTVVFGTYNDPVFGTSKGEFVADFLTPTTDSMNFGTSPVVDSLVILIPHRAGHCGNVNTPQTINVYELADTLGADDDSNPTIGSSLFDFTGTSFYKPEVLASVSVKKKFRVTAAVMSSSDISVTEGTALYTQLDNVPKDVDYTEEEFCNKLGKIDGVSKDFIFKNLEYDTIHIPLPASFVQRATGYITGTIEEDIDVLNYMKGFYFESPASNGACLFRLDLINAVVRLYYHNTTETTSFDFTVNSRTFRHNNLTHTYSATINDAINAGETDKSYIQGMNGLRTRLKINGIEKFAGKNINKAELILGIDSLSQDYKYSYTPDQLKIKSLNTNGNIDSLSEFYYSSSYPCMPQLTTANKREYRLLITSYANNLLNKKNSDGLYIQSYEADDLRKLILYRNKIKLKITYSNLIQ